MGFGEVAVGGLRRDDAGVDHRLALLEQEVAADRAGQVEADRDVEGLAGEAARTDGLVGGEQVADRLPARQRRRGRRVARHGAERVGLGEDRRERAGEAVRQRLVVHSGAGACGPERRGGGREDRPERPAEGPIANGGGKALELLPRGLDPANRARPAVHRRMLPRAAPRVNGARTEACGFDRLAAGPVSARQSAPGGAGPSFPASIWTAMAAAIPSGDRAAVAFGVRGGRGVSPGAPEPVRRRAF